MEKRELVGKGWLGERIVAWRGARGRLVCPFHAYEYDITGQCVATPYAPAPGAPG